MKGVWTEAKLIDASRNEWSFRLTDKEVRKALFRRLSFMNPELMLRDIRRSRTAREYKVRYCREGKDVRMAIGVDNLKRLFGAFILGFETGGIRFRRRLRKELSQWLADGLDKDLDMW